MPRVTIERLNDELTGGEFEDVLKDLFTRMGYKATRTQQTRDGGKDVIIKQNGESIYVEAKRQKGSISSETARGVLGAASGTSVEKVMLFTTASLTKSAKDELDRSEYDTMVVNGRYLEYLLNYYDVDIDRFKRETA